VKLETQIRRLARSKVKVKITKRKRGNFYVCGPDGEVYRAMTKAEALQNLKARLRCWQTGDWNLMEGEP